MEENITVIKTTMGCNVMQCIMSYHTFCIMVNIIQHV